MSSLSKKVLSLVLGACVVATLFAASMVPASAKVDTTKFTEDFTDSTLEKVLTYTDNDGTTTRDDFVISSLDNFGDKKFLTWNNAETTAQAGINQRLNIAKEKGNFKLTSFSFKMPLYSTDNKYHPAYILFGKDSETTQKAMVLGGRHNDTFMGFNICQISLTPDSEVNSSNSAWNSKAYTSKLLEAENQKVLVTYTVSINWANNTATVAFSKPAADGVDGSYDYALSGNATVDFANFEDVYFALSAGRLGSGPVYITDVETTYEYEYVSHDWINEVNPNTADAEDVLSYTAADGQTDMEPVVTNIAGANAVTWNSNKTTGASGETNQRINIAPEKNGLPLTSFSFKSLAVTNNGNATPVYVLFGSSEDKATQTVVALGGKKNTGKLNYVLKTDVANPATGSVNGGSSVFNQNETGTLRTDVDSEIGKEYYRFTVKLYGTYAKIIAEDLDANGNVEWSGETQNTIYLSTVANPYYAISSGWASSNNFAYVTDIQAVYAEPEMLGATIRKTASADEQDIMFGSQIRIEETVADEYTPAGYGMLLARTADIKNETQPMTADVENANVTNLYHEVGEDTDFTYTVTINRSAVAGNSGKKFSARAYVKYVNKAGNAIYVYSEQIAKSVYGYAKDMAADVIASGNVAADYTLSDETVVNYLEANINAAINGKSNAEASFDAEHKNEDHLLAFIYANRDYNA